MIRGGTTRLVAAATLAVVLAAACSGSSATEDGLPPPISLDSTTSSSTTTTRASTTSTTTSTTAAPTEKPLLEIPTEWESDLDEIYGRYLLYWDAFFAAMGPPEPDPDYPPLAELADRSLLEELRGQIKDRREAGEYYIDPESSATDHGLRLPSPSLLSKTEGNEVVIQDCFVNGLEIRTLTGDLVDDAVVADLLNVKMKVVDGEWRVLAVRDAAPESSGYAECKGFAEQR